MKITTDAVVVLRYRVFDADGELVESADEDEPITYRHGHQKILPGLEQALEGAGVGDELRISLEPEEAFGVYDPEGIVAIPRSEFPAELDIEPGEWVTVRVEEAETEDEDDELELRVLEVHPEQILLDANHPLAGQRVAFELEVVSVEPPR